jgi:DNA-binding ferritin-like protein
MKECKMKKRSRLIESVEMHVIATANNADIVFQNMVASWRGMPYGELSALLGYLTYLSNLHHTHHWIAAGDPSYSDHLLFQRLYDSAVGEIDSLGEKAVGLGGINNVDQFTLANQVAKWTGTFESTQPTVPGFGGLSRKSLDAEMMFIKYIDAASSMLQEQGLLTKGLDNQLAGFFDSHETNIYLLKQRIGQFTQGF